MRVRIGVVVAALAVGGALAACGDDGDDRVSLDAWLEQVDAACAEENAELELLATQAPAVDPTSPDLTDEELAELGAFLESVLRVGDEVSEAIREVGTPDERTDEVDDLVRQREEAREEMQAAADAASAADLGRYRTSFEEASRRFEDASAAARDLGLEDCGAQ